MLDNGRWTFDIGNKKGRRLQDVGIAYLFVEWFWVRLGNLGGFEDL